MTSRCGKQRRELSSNRRMDSPRRAVFLDRDGVINRAVVRDGLRVCYHDDADNCRCRKPKPGMLEDAARDAGIDLSRSFMVGDRWRDVDAGRRAGCATIFVDHDYSERRPEGPDATVGSLPEA